MATKTYSISFDNDSTNPRVVKGTVTLDGVVYDVVVAPTKRRVIRKDANRIEEQSVSQGPRNGCPMCGR